MISQEEGPLTGKRKAAIFMVLLGEELAINVYRNLPDMELRIITEEIAELEFVSPEVAAKVLQEYHELSLSNQGFVVQGGPEQANKLLVKAFGEQGAKTFIEEVSRVQQLSEQNLATLKKSDPQQLAKFIQGEHPQTIALVLAHLDVRMAREVLMQLPEKVRGFAVRRLAQMQQFSPDMVKKISVILHKRLQVIGQQNRKAYGGVKAVADLLNQIDHESTTSILETIEEGDTDLATSIRNLMFTFQDFLEVPETGLRELLGQLDKKTLATALKGAPEDLKNHFFKCMSTRAVEMLKEDMDALGPIRSRDVNAARQEAVTVARRLEGEGKMVLKTEQEESYVV
ncbi:MAG TPA: flagellar motor switch protein FliG [Candidatus Acidoferrum sp.]|jgi:flagellar motor switch protein FliG